MARGRSLPLMGCLALLLLAGPALGRKPPRRGSNKPEKFCVTDVNGESDETKQQDVCVVAMEGNAFFVCRLASGNDIPKATFQDDAEEEEEASSAKMQTQVAASGRIKRKSDNPRPPHRMRDCMALQLREFKEIKEDNTEDAEKRVPKIKLDSSTRTVEDVTVGGLAAIKVTMTADLKTKTDKTKYATMTASVYLFKAAGNVAWGTEDTAVEKGTFKTEVGVEYVDAATNKEAQIVWDIFPRASRGKGTKKSVAGKKKTEIDLDGKESVVAFGEYKRTKKGSTTEDTAAADATVDVGDTSAQLSVKFPLKDGADFVKKFSYDPIATVKPDTKTSVQADRRGEGNPQRFCAENVNGESDETKKQDVCVVSKEGNAFFICRLNKKNPIPDPELDDDEAESTHGKQLTQDDHGNHSHKKPKKAKAMRDCMSVQLKEYAEYSDEGTTVARKVENVKFAAAEGAVAADTTLPAKGGGTIDATKIELSADLVAHGQTAKFATLTFRVYILKASGLLAWGDEDVQVVAGNVKTESEVVYVDTTTNKVADLKWRIVPRSGRKGKPTKKDKAGKKQVAVEVGSEEKVTVFGQFKQKVGSAESLEDVALPAADLALKAGEAMLTTRFSLVKGGAGINGFTFDPVVEVASDAETDSNTDEVSLEGRGEDTPDKMCIENVNGETDKEKMQDVCVLSKQGRSFFVCRLSRKNRLPKPEEEAEATTHKGMSIQMNDKAPPKPKGLRDCMAIQLRGYKEMDASDAEDAARKVPRLTLSAASATVTQEDLPGDTTDVPATKVTVVGELKAPGNSATKFADFTFTLYMIKEDGTIKWNAETAAVKKGSFKTAGKITYLADATNDFAELEFAIIPRQGRTKPGAQKPKGSGSKLVKVAIGDNDEEEFELFGEVKAAATAGGATEFVDIPDPVISPTNKEIGLKMKMPVKGKREIIFDPTATVKADDNTVKEDTATDGGSTPAPGQAGTNPVANSAPVPIATVAPTAAPSASSGNMNGPLLALSLVLMAFLAFLM